MKKFFSAVFIVFISISVFATSSVTAGWRLSGRVVDENNNPLVGASVQLVHTFKGAFTNEDGYYQIKGLKAGAYSLQVSFVGYADIKWIFQ